MNEKGVWRTIDAVGELLAGIQGLVGNDTNSTI